VGVTCAVNLAAVADSDDEDEQDVVTTSHPHPSRLKSDVLVPINCGFPRFDPKHWLA
jgi:hypothetical protein